MSKEELDTVNNINVYLNGEEYTKYKIIKYTIIYKPVNGEAKMVKSQGSVITSFAGEFFNYNKGDKIIFSDIHVNVEGKEPKRLRNPLVIEVE